MKSNVARFLKRIQNTQVEEINCSECLDQISRYVDLELATGEANRQMPRVRQHLEQCTVCHEEYQVLRDLARLEATDQTPDTAELIQRLKHHTE